MNARVTYENDFPTEPLESYMNQDLPELQSEPGVKTLITVREYERQTGRKFPNGAVELPEFSQFEAVVFKQRWDGIYVNDKGYYIIDADYHPHLCYDRFILKSFKNSIFLQDYIKDFFFVNKAELHSYFQRYGREIGQMKFNTHHFTPGTKVVYPKVTSDNEMVGKIITVKELMYNDPGSVVAIFEEMAPCIIDKTKIENICLNIDHIREIVYRAPGNPVFVNQLGASKERKMSDKQRRMKDLVFRLQWEFQLQEDKAQAIADRLPKGYEYIGGDTLHTFQDTDKADFFAGGYILPEKVMTIARQRGWLKTLSVPNSYRGLYMDIYLVNVKKLTKLFKTHDHLFREPVKAAQERIEAMYEGTYESDLDY